MNPSPPSLRATATRSRLKSAALDLFERRGYRSVTVEDIAAAAGVSHMTFFRYFPTKDSVLLDDPFDPLIADAIAAQPQHLPAIERVARGMLSLTPHLGDELSRESRRGIAIASGVPELQAGMAANLRLTENVIVERAGAGDPRSMRLAAAALLAAIGAALLDWAASDRHHTLGELVAEAVTTVVPSVGQEQP